MASLTLSDPRLTLGSTPPHLDKRPCRSYSILQFADSGAGYKTFSLSSWQFSLCVFAHGLLVMFDKPRDAHELPGSSNKVN
jgi:hypothetical protein